MHSQILTKCFFKSMNHFKEDLNVEMLFTRPSYYSNYKINRVLDFV